MKADPPSGAQVRRAATIYASAIVLSLLAYLFSPPLVVKALGVNAIASNPRLRGALQIIYTPVDWIARHFPPYGALLASEDRMLGLIRVPPQRHGDQK